MFKSTVACLQTPTSSAGIVNFFQEVHLVIFFFFSQLVIFFRERISEFLSQASIESERPFLGMCYALLFPSPLNQLKNHWINDKSALGKKHWNGNLEI